MENDFKFCPGCKINLPKNEYHARNRKTKWLRSLCIGCARRKRKLPENITKERARVRVWLSKNREKSVMHTKAWVLNNPIQAIYSEYKSNAKRRGRDFHLSVIDFLALLAGPCFYCGFVGVVGVDRADNKMGYTKENSRSCCELCNRAKMDNSSEVFIALCRSVAANHPAK